ncbi:anti-sigma factor [Pseudoruegeria sp. HB172150]|uniref:anti-sigma factor family protein n=1 Tax=Pseudoruegeria sp. HB172150 TaxID=2721164 RepID=UPI001551EF7C|nr:hypothetical protein [Pseudoruegeria sp. HB172150]
MNRQQIETLLPLLANGTLEGAERDEVEAAVAEDADLRAELEALRAIRTTMQSEETYSPGEMGLARLMRDVGEQPASAEPAMKTVIRTRIWQAVAAVLLVMVVGQYAFQMPGDTTEDGYSLASGDEAGRVSIAFVPDATEEQIRSLLLQAGVEIVAGPSAIGFYDLQLLEGVTPEQVYGILDNSEIVDTLNFPED